MDKPLVSVIMSAFNAERFICASIESVLQQTYPNVELIICDDGSNDQTAALIKRYPSVKYIYQNNQGQGAGRNHAAQKAQGNFLAFLDADDIWTPEKLETQIPMFAHSPDIGAVYCDMEIVDTSGRILGYNAKGRMKRGFIFDDLIAGNYMCGLSSLVVRTEIFREAGGFSNHRYCQDFVFILRVAHKYQIDFSEESMVKYLSHENSTTSKIDVSYPEQIDFYKQIPTLYCLNEQQVFLVREELKRLYFAYAILHFRRKNFSKAAGILQVAKEQGLMIWKSRVLSAINTFPARNFLYSKI